MLYLNLKTVVRKKILRLITELEVYVVPFGISLIRSGNSCKGLPDFTHWIVSIDTVPVFNLYCDV